MGSLRSSTASNITPAQRLTPPVTPARAAGETPTQAVPPPTGAAPETAEITDTNLVRGEVTAGAQASLDPEVIAAAQRTADAVQGQDVLIDDLTRFQEGELPEVSAAPPEQSSADISTQTVQIAPETLTSWNATLREQAADFQMPTRTEAQQNTLNTLRQDLDQAEVNLETAIGQAEGPEQEALESNLAQVRATRTRLEAFENLDQARRNVLDAPNLRAFREERAAMETAQQNFVTQMASTETVLPDNATDNETILALAQQDTDALSELVENPDAATSGLFRTLDRGGYTPESRFNNYRGFNLMRTDRHPQNRTRNREDETVNAPGFVQSLRNDTADSAARLQQYTRLSRDIASADPPMTEQQIGRRVRGIFSSQSGALTVSQNVVNSLTASFQAEGDAARARRAMGDAQSGLDAASDSLLQGNIALSQEDMETSRAMFDQARTQRQQAGADRDRSEFNGNRATERASRPIAGDLPPAERQARTGANANTLASVQENRTAIAGFDEEANRFDADLTAAETEYTATETELAEEAQRLADIEERLEGTPYREELLDFVEDIMKMGDTGVIEGSITGRAGVGTANFNATVGLEWSLVAEKAWGQGSAFTLRSELTLSAELRANVGFMDFKAGVDSTMREGMHMRDEAEVAEFVMRMNDVAAAYLDGDTGRINAAKDSFFDFVGDRRFTGSGNSLYAEGEVTNGNPNSGVRLAAGASRSSDTSNYFGVDRNGDGDISRSERELRIQAQDEELQMQVGAGDFTATVGWRSSTVTASDDPNVRVGDSQEMYYAEVAVNPGILRRVRAGEMPLEALASDIANGLANYGQVVDSGALGRQLESAFQSGDYYGNSNNGGQLVVGVHVEDNRLYPVVGYQYERSGGGMAQAGSPLVVGAEASFRMAGRNRIGNGIPVGGN